uniref:Uncharacterized protein n=1 Tax=Coprothermobacter proteolyticus (strain ATCC 35245 / DSM 5265 / OCM 4 / BT) TaxID=309798 RepID=B5Y9I8_COPPD
MFLSAEVGSLSVFRVMLDSSFCRLVLSAEGVIIAL